MISRMLYSTGDEPISNITRGDHSAVARAHLLADKIKQAVVFDHVSIVLMHPTLYRRLYNNLRTTSTLHGDREPITNSASFSYTPQTWGQPK